MPTTTEIDPVEAALAVIGVRPILSREVERVLVSQVREMHELGQSIVREAKHVVRGEGASIPLGSVNYKRMLNDLTEQFTEEQLVEMVNKFPRELHAISSLFLVKARQVKAFLLTLLPIATRDTLLGPENMLPPALAIRRFATSLDVLDNPMRVFAHIASGSLLKSQAVVVKEVYPTISAAIEEALDDAATDERARKQSYKIPPLVEIGIRAWRNQPRFPQRLQAALQANFVKAKAEQPKPQASQTASGGQASVVAKEAMSNVQRSLYPQPKAG